MCFFISLLCVSFLAEFLAFSEKVGDLKWTQVLYTKEIEMRLNRINKGRSTDWTRLEVWWILLTENPIKHELCCTMTLLFSITLSSLSLTDIYDSSAYFFLPKKSRKLNVNKILMVHSEGAIASRPKCFAFVDLIYYCTSNKSMITCNLFIILILLSLFIIISLLVFRLKLFLLSNFVLV